MPIFVCGATGIQGGAIVRNLHDAGIKTHAIARDRTSPASQALLAAGVSLTKGEFDDPDDDAIRQSMHGCTGVFMNFMPDLRDLSRERKWATRILSIAQETSTINHIIYSTGFGVQDPTRFKNPDSLVARSLASKRAIEGDVRAAGFKYWTILRPGNFMTNFLPPHVHLIYRDLVATGCIRTALLPDTILPMVDPNDIGRFGAEAFLNPDRFHAKEIELASELRGLDDLIAVLSRVTGRDLKVEYMSPEEIEEQLATNPLLEGQMYARDMVRYVDMDQVRAWGIPLGSFETFLEREKDRAVKAYS